MLRFTILAHHVAPGFDREPDGIHNRSIQWEWLFEPVINADALWTWATAPMESDSASIKAVRLAHHRPIYLTYEGPLTRDRGSVSQLASGTYQWVTQRDQHYRLKLTYDRFVSSVPFGSEIEMRLDYSSLGPSDPGSTWTFRIGNGPSGSSKADAIS